MKRLTILALSASFFAIAACSGGEESPSGGSAGSTASGTGAGGSGSTASSAGGAGGSGGTGGAGAGGGSTGKPIDAPANQWTWVPFDDAFCADGTTTGIGINPGADKSGRLLIYLEGGGACWDEATCYTLKTAANFADGYGADKFASDAKGLDGSLFDRNDPENVFKDDSFVYVPYCTG